MGYYDCITPPVIQRNILENPGWYTQYTPYQAEIAQGRLEALLNFQTMVADLTGAAARQRLAARRGHGRRRGHAHVPRRRPRPDAPRFFVSEDCHPQTIAVVQTRAEPLGIDVAWRTRGRDRPRTAASSACCVQYPATDGRVRDYAALVRARARAPARWSWSRPTCWR